MARPTMLASASGELKTRSSPNSALQAVRDLEHAALARDHRPARPARLASATSSPKTTMRGLRAISSLQRAVDRRRPSCRACPRAAPASRTRPRSDRRRASRRQSAAVSCAGFGAASACRRASLTSRSTSAAIAAELLVGREPVRRSGTRANRVDRIALRFGLALRRRLVELLVVGQRVRVRADARCACTKRRALARAARRRPPRASRAGWRGSRCRRSSRRAGRGTIATSREMSPPAVCTSTGTEIA